MSSYEIRQGDVLDRLREMPDESVHCVVTSPPYWGLRSYGIEGQLGLEATPDEFVANMVAVFREVRRVLRSDGSAWVNMGDSYSGAGYSNHANTGGAQREDGGKQTHTLNGSTGLKAKDLCMIPARLALALQSDGWWIRSEITWCKRAPMPESVRDRPTSATEKIYLLTKSERYFYDADAVREPHLDPVRVQAEIDRQHRKRTDNGALKTGDALVNHSTKWAGDKATANAGRNMWNYWLLSPDAFAEAHFATFPKEIPRRAILAGTSERGVCGACGAPHRRVVVTSGGMIGKGWHDHSDDANAGMSQAYRADGGDTPYKRESVGWQPTCPCGADAPTVPATVLDPFCGAGTTLLVAVQHGRRGLGIELNPDYIAMSEKRIHNQGAPLFSWADGQGQAQQDPNSQAVGSL